MSNFFFVDLKQISEGWKTRHRNTHRLNEVVFDGKTAFHHFDTVYLRALDCRICGGSFQLFRINGNKSQNFHAFISALNFWIIHSSFGIRIDVVAKLLHCYQLSKSQTDFHISIRMNNKIKSMNQCYGLNFWPELKSEYFHFTWNSLFNLSFFFVSFSRNFSLTNDFHSGKFMW